MIELRFEHRKVDNYHRGTRAILQQRTKTKWIDGSTVNGGYYDWSEWEDVPVVQGDKMSNEEISQRKINMAKAALEKLSCLGNGEHYGNSKGNVIAQEALKELNNV